MVRERGRASAPARTLRAKLAQDDRAHSFALLSVILTLAMMSTALAIQQVQTLEAGDPSPPGIESRLADIYGIRAALTADVLDAALPRVPFNHTRDNLTADVLARLRLTAHEAGFAASLTRDTEAEAAHHTTFYAAWSHDGAREYISPFDGVDDGIIWETPCPSTQATGGCATGFFLRLRLTDGEMTLSEMMILSTRG